MDLSFAGSRELEAEWLRGGCGAGVLVYREATLLERWSVRRSDVTARGVVDAGGELVAGRLYALEAWCTDGQSARVGYLRVVATDASGRSVVHWHRGAQARRERG